MLAWPASRPAPALVGHQPCFPFQALGKFRESPFKDPCPQSGGPGGGAAKLPRSQQLTCRRLMPTLWPCHISRCSKRGCAPTATHNTHAWRCFKTKLRDHATSKTSIDEYMSAKLNSFVRALQTAVRHVQLIYSFVQEERVNFYKFVDSHFPEISGVPGAKINLITFSCNMRT